MKNKTKALTAGLLTIAALSAAPGLAKEGMETLTAVWRDIKIIVDGTQIDPRDVNGNSTEPFISNGTTYLPVRAVGAAFGKEVSWDGTTSTVTLGIPVAIPQKAMPMHNRPYMECSSTTKIKMYEEKGTGYIKCEPSSNGHEVEHDPDPRYAYDEFITFSTNGLAKTVSGEYYLSSGINNATEGRLRIYNQNGNELYCSPIVRNSTAPQHFEVDVTNEIAVKFVFESEGSDKWASNTMYIKNPTIVTSDY